MRETIFLTKQMPEAEIELKCRDQLESKSDPIFKEEIVNECIIRVERGGEDTIIISIEIPKP